MLDKLQQIKIKYYFDLRDKNKDGYLEMEDFLIDIATIAELRGLEEGSPEYEQLKTDYLSWWEYQVRIAGKN